MRPFFRMTLLVLVVSVVLLAAAESTRSLYNKGQDAEARQDYIAAFEFYRQAYEQKPKELKFRIAYQRTRFLASAGHVNKGQDLREQGKLPEALEQFEYAAKIDPSNKIAIQEMVRTRNMIEKVGKGDSPPPAPMPISPITRRKEEAGGPIDLAPLSNQPITLEISNDSKMVYETVGKLAGLNVIFDPDYTSKRVTLKLNGVSLQESLDTLAFLSNTFWRPITPNTIFIAANTPAKRKDLEQYVLKTFYLSNIGAASDLQEVVQAIRTLTDLQKLQQINSQNAIIVRGTPDQVALAEKIIDDIDKAKPEVIVEVAVMQVRRDKMRDLGIRPPTSTGGLSIGLQPATATTPTTTTTGTATSNNSGINLNTLSNLTDKDIAVTIPAATVNLLYSDSNSRLIQNPQIRALDGLKASLKIGDRVPIATGSFGSGFGAGGLGASGLVNTQFQYIDVGVNVDITPRVYPNREVGLKLVLDVSSVTGSSNIGGITQPIISQRKVEHEIRLREGEVNLLGGIFEQQDTNSISGIPGLAQLPFLKYFFGEDKKERVDSEIVFILIPHIIRSQELTELNLRAIDVGTSNQIDLRRVTKPDVSKPANPAPQTPVPQTAVPQTQAPAVKATQPTADAGSDAGAGFAQPPATMASNTQPTTAEASTPATVYFDPAATSQVVGTNFTVNVMIKGARDIYSAPLQIIYDPKTVQLVSISNGDLLSKDGQPVALVHRDDAASGTIQANATRPPNSGGVSGDGVLYVLTFQAKVRGDSTLNAVRPSFRNAAMQPVVVSANPSSISIK